MTDVERNVEYVPRNAHIEATQCNRIKHTPINGSTFTKTNDFIEFRLNPDGTFIDAPRTRLNLKLSATGGVSSASTGIFTSPSIWSVFTRLEIRQGGRILENVIDQNRTYSALSKIYTSTNQSQMVGSITDCYEVPATTQQNISAVGIKLSTGSDPVQPVYRTHNVSVPLALSNLLGSSASKAYPNAMLKEPTMIRLYITNNVEEVLYAQAVGSTPTYNADTTFTLKDVSLEMTHIRYGPEVMSQIKGEAEGDNEVMWDGVQCISSTNSIGYSSTERVIMPGTSYSDVRNVIIQQWYPTLASNQITMGCSPLNGTYQAQLYLDGNPIARNRPVGASRSNEPINSVAELAQSVLSLVRPFNVIDDANTQISLSRSVTASSTRLNFTNNNAGGGPTGRPYDLVTTPVPLTSIFSPVVNHASGVYFGYVGFDLVRNGDPSRAQIGHDLRGRQLVYEARQTNAIPGATTPCVVQAILNVGVKYVLDRSAGTLRTIY
tara:strand:- start:159 stop:1634 length:1476 start_codon:yes stop_codon:yes gene_type:complete